jgi:TPR repeat protein
LEDTLIREVAEETGGTVTAMRQIGAHSVLYPYRERDLDLAVQLYSEASEAGSPRGCANLGNRYEAGAGVEVDQNGARELWERACDDGYRRASRQKLNLEPIICSIYSTDLAFSTLPN